MADVKSAKKDLLENCEEFLGVLKRKPPEEGEQFVITDIVALSRSLYQNLNTVMEEGDDLDKQESLMAFAEVTQTFKEVFSKLGNLFGGEPAVLKGLSKNPSFAFKPEVTLTKEQRKTTKELSDALEAMAKAKKK